MEQVSANQRTDENACKVGIGAYLFRFYAKICFFRFYFKDVFVPFLFTK